MAPRKTKKTQRKPKKVETPPPEDVESKEELEEIEEIPEESDEELEEIPEESDEELEEIPEDEESDEELEEIPEDEEELEEDQPPAKTKRGPKKAAAQKAKKAPVRRQKKNSSDDDTEEPGKRYFKILVDSISAQSDSPIVPIGDDKKELSSNGGRYTGKNPMQAAKKAFTRICRAAADGGECEYVFSIQETTQSSTKKVFTYRGKREELDEPQQIVKGGGEPYNIRFTSKVWSYKEEKADAKKAPAKKAAAKKVPAKKAAAKKAPVDVVEEKESAPPTKKAPAKRGRKKKS